ncbi:hypothetical protein SIN8267_02840 [Sinobacterium norvegicum]|uniref:J domain-containing protein n=1 Tax=Sinobacterium norvegicum TaxID=1641715 RepID=A0ABN8EP13_9GAMM|nr:DnaJ domain-containing protein [Sinobacterium norvegicum]CAH0992707.1 hypothetical protein SIN8267_02840 [Sinobacterium norvegicum]
MSRLILLLALIGGLYILYLLYRQASPQKRKKMLWQYGIGAVVIMTVIAALTGKASWLGAIAATTFAFGRRFLPLIIRYLPFAQGLLSRSGLGRAKISSSFIQLSIDSANGNIDGIVVQGRFEGRQLSDLNDREIKQLEKDCQEDAKSRRLLAAYLIRHRGKQQQQQSTPPANTSMAEAEALAILGLQPGAEKEEIIKAHKRLIQKMHPDRGGSDFLAAQINQAKDTLIS